MSEKPTTETPCQPNVTASRVCEMGTKGCTVQHEPAQEKRWSCRLCGYAVLVEDLERCRSHGRHTDALGRDNQPNNGVAYCINCLDETLRPEPAALDPLRCTDFAPAGFAGHWRDYHRGHGCDKDPERIAPDPLREAMDAGKRHRFALEEWELYSKEPESLSVGQLNWAVRALREERYQIRLKSQELREALLEAREALEMIRDWKASSTMSLSGWQRKWKSTGFLDNPLPERALSLIERLGL